MNKEELLAEEYICDGKCQDDITGNYIHCKTCTRIRDFLAGLKVGRPQWHDLRKDPTDLPKTDKDVIVYRKDSGSDFDYYKGGAWFGNANGYESEQPIAWCEIPTFDKENE